MRGILVDWLVEVSRRSPIWPPVIEMCVRFKKVSSWTTRLCTLRWKWLIYTCQRSRWVFLYHVERWDFILWLIGEERRSAVDWSSYLLDRVQGNLRHMRQHPIFLAIGGWEDTTHGWWLPLRLWRRLHVRLLALCLICPWFANLYGYFTCSF